MNVILRKCVKCKDFKPATHEFFYKDKNRALGLMYRCKECDSKRKDKRVKRYSSFTEEEKIKKKDLARKYGKTKKGKAIGHLSAYRNTDKKKGFLSDLTREDMMLVVTLPCFYCGYLSSGYDRINNNLGHTKMNCVPACKECNIARMDNFSHEEMKIIGEAIRQIKEKREKDFIPGTEYVNL